MAAKSKGSSPGGPRKPPELWEGAQSPAVAVALKKPFVSVTPPVGQGPGGWARPGRARCCLRDPPSPGGVWQLGFMAAVPSIPGGQRQEGLRTSPASVTEQRLQAGALRSPRRHESHRTAFARPVHRRRPQALEAALHPDSCGSKYPLFQNIIGYTPKCPTLRSKRSSEVPKNNNKKNNSRALDY